MKSKWKIIESVVRIVFGALCLIAGTVVEILLSGPYTLVSVVLFINGAACIVSGVLSLVRLRRAAEKKKEEEMREMAKEIEKVL